MLDNLRTALPLLVYLFTLSMLFMVFMCGDPTDDTILGRSNRFLSKDLPAFMRAAVVRVPWLGPRVVVGADRSYDYVCHKPNPLMQLVYLVLVVGGYCVFMLRAFPLIEHSSVSNVHKLISNVVVAVTVYSFVKASNSSPGRINEVCIAWRGLLWLRIAWFGLI
jgi:hypothetical protein